MTEYYCEIAAGSPEGEANARLIAAAPDMLLALVALHRATLDECVEPQDIKRAADAIAKATAQGETGAQMTKEPSEAGLDYESEPSEDAMREAVSFLRTACLGTDVCTEYNKRCVCALRLARLIESPCSGAKGEGCEDCG